MIPKPLSNSHTNTVHTTPMEAQHNHASPPPENESDDGVISSWLTADDETTAQLSKLLESFDSTPPPQPTKVRFTENPYSSSLLLFQTSAGYVTIDGNDESCGSSFSETESFMASTDLCGLINRVQGEEVRGEDVDWNQFLLDDDDFDVFGGGDDADWMAVLGGGDDDAGGGKRKKEKW